MSSWELMDWIVVAGVIAAILGTYFAWKSLRGGKLKTTNTINHGDNNTQTGGSGTTDNRVDHGSNNKQSG
ncbi:hypothetical protein [Parasedimentitalea psychrophila]|uniref:Uncharacterized protein n=1 Tax=Parasedimentitalea psychrophila TaxID=2997337 RepID=A0A9Y2L047_9RHOB|nr:hypothetical protein [Parasedimentitalea psychrophila]WIY25525.1 hypothetical protein QPJ95_00775 [Parasedimentitalea psychrophila]